MREASGDEKHYGDPEVQKAIALFRKVPREATYEDLTKQEGPDVEPMDVEDHPFNQEVADDLMPDDASPETEGLSEDNVRSDWVPC